MPDAKYDFWLGDLDLIAPAASVVDGQITEFLTVFAAASDSTRANERELITMEGFYELLAFSKRMAVFALRTGDLEQLRLGLTSIAAIDRNRVDFRDVLLTMSLLHHATERNGLDARRLFENAAALASPDTATLIRGFLNRSPEQRDIRRSWGYDEIETDVGLGFVRWGFQPYQPTCELKKLALDVGKVLAADRYQLSSVSVATNLPAVWLPAGTPDQERRRDAAIQRIIGAATVSGKLRPELHPRSDAQRLTIFMAECAEEDDCAVLRSLSISASPRRVALGMGCGRLFALVTARSFIDGVENYETQQTLERFYAPITNILVRAR